MFVYLLAEKLRKHPTPTQEYDEYGLLPDEHPVNPEVEGAFSSAAAFVANNTSRIPEKGLLYLYGRYKQATAGPPDASSRPGMFSLQARRKYQAWDAVRLLTREESMNQYAAKVTSLGLGWDPDTETSSTPSTSFGLRPSRPMETDEVDDVDSNPKELFFDAVKNGDTEQARKLLALQADLTGASDTDGQTPLHWACDAGHNEVVEMLVNSGADVNARDKDGLTPLHYAAMCSHPLTVRLLLDKGADPTIRDNDDQTPYEVAQFDENREILAI